MALWEQAGGGDTGCLVPICLLHEEEEEEKQLATLIKVFCSHFGNGYQWSELDEEEPPLTPKARFYKPRNYYVKIFSTQLGTEKRRQGLMKRMVSRRNMKLN